MNALQKSRLHFRYRWIGLPLLITGGCLFLLALSAYRETQDWFVCLLGFGCTMLGLTSFGVNHDTAVAFALEAEKDDSDLSATMRTELDEDLSWNRAATLAIQPTPKTALLLPWCVLALQFYVFWRIMCVLTFPVAGKASVCSLSIFPAQTSVIAEPFEMQSEDSVEREETDSNSTTDSADNVEMNVE